MALRGGKGGNPFDFIEQNRELLAEKSQVPSSTCSW